MGRLLFLSLMPCLVVPLYEALHLTASDKLTLIDDYDSPPFPDVSKGGFAFWEVQGVVHATGRNYTAHVAALSGGLPDTFSYIMSPGGCCHRTKTSTIAQLHNCTYATNAGFFSLLFGCCVGNLITNGSIVQLPGTIRVNFGLTAESYVIGYLTNTTLPKLGLSELVTGAGWLVRGGQSYVNESVEKEDINEDFVTLKAPRTVIGVHSNRSLYLVQVDGVEKEKVGLDLYELTEVLLTMGLAEAVNLDGGGSSVSVYKGKVISSPTCLDTPFICERPVATITCLRPI